ncbi:MAG: alpha-rhamnosidase, partial [Verrucomicrobia bacterium]|nr:alpha-rhamnosidase [Verrucomicrobiota bacterium]
MKSRILLLRALPLLLLISPATHAAEEAPAPTPSTAKVVDLRVESQTNPTALNTPLPRFSWRIETEERGWLQKSYHILVASTPELLAQDKGDLWDSGKVPGRTSQFVPFQGLPLPSGQEVHWKVKSQNHNEQFTDWSAAAMATVTLSGP